MSKLDKDSVIEKFNKAYEAANGKAPSVEANGGWYSVDGGKNMRLAQLDALADELASGAPVAKKAEAKAPAKKEKAPAAKTKTKPAAKKSSGKKPASSFSVKDFYTKQILEANPGNIAPR